MDVGPENALYNLRDAARAVLNWERVAKIKLTPARRAQLKEISELTPRKIEMEKES